VVEAPPPHDAHDAEEPGRPGGNPVTTDRVFTIPNLLSFARLRGVPVFLWLPTLVGDGHSGGP
jgi:hypothetical protein